tara:strand:- start:186 stop:1172 length:987 start_codon:yes stop_codon:yes gene_type:complete
LSEIELIKLAKNNSVNKVVETPLLSNEKVNQIIGKNVLIKAECLQVTGSFKFRGAWSALSYLKSKNRILDGVVAYSSGNHAQGIAAAAKAHKVPAIIVMPKDAPSMKIENTLDYGAEIFFYDRMKEVREDIGERIAKEKNLQLIRPYDDPLVIAGQGTCGLEIAAQAKALGIKEAEVLVCCGGGGLSAGIALALEEFAPSFYVRTCEPKFFDDTARSLRSGKREKNSKLVQSICDAILTPTPGELTFPILKRLAGHGLVASDDQVLRAMKCLYENFKLVAEPGGAVALAAALFSAQRLEKENIIVVVSGGNVDSNIFAQALSKKSITR